MPAAAILVCEVVTGTFALPQLENAIAASEFRHDFFGSELSLCKYYFERIQSDGVGFIRIASGYAEGTSNGKVVLLYGEKRAIPTISLSAAATFAIGQAGTDTVASGISATNIGKKSALLLPNSAGAFTTGQGIILLFQTTAGFIDIIAEI